MGLTDLGPRQLDVVVTSAREIARDVVLLTLGGGEPLPEWRPGDHVALDLPNGLTRQYSLCGSPDDVEWSIAVRLEDDSRGGSEFLHTKVVPGDRLDARGPFANYALEEAPAYLFVAGGIGVTPLLPMIEQVADQGRSWQCVYLGREQASMPFLDRLRRHGERVTAHTTRGRSASRYDIAGLLAATGPGTLVYCCGPEGLISAVEGALPTALAGRLRVERFSPKEVSAPAAVPFEVELARSGMTLTVPADRSLLDVLLDADADVVSSCEEGTCGTCEVAVLGGVPVHQDSLLSEADQLAGDRMLVCVSRCAGGRLVLDL